MKPFVDLLRWILGILLIGHAGSACANNLDGLLSNSPFAGPSAAPPAPSAASPGLELRSVLIEGDSYVFSVFDPSTKQSFWIRLNESGKPIVAREYDRAGETLKVELNGHPMTVVLQKAKNPGQNPVAAVASNAIRHPVLVSSQIRIPEAFIASKPVDLEPRLQQVASEIQARRIARRAAIPSPN